MPNERILIVEDDPAVAGLIKRCLESSGYTVAGAVTAGEDALLQAGSLRPDLVLMDIDLGGDMDGVETAERLQVRFNVPVVFLTGLADDATVQRSQRARAFGYVLKPFRREELKASIDLALNKHKVESKLRKIEHWFTAAVKSIADAVITVDAGGAVTFLNPMAEALTGWKRDAAVGRQLGDVFCIIDEQTRAAPVCPMEPVLREGWAASLPRQPILVTGHGAEVPIEGSAGPIRNEAGQLLGGVLIFRDVTERRQAEAELQQSREQLRSLAARLQTVREEERQALSREVHDELGQMLTGLKMDLSWLDRRFQTLADKAAQAPLLDKARSMSALLDAMVQSVRKISAELRPGVLDDLGLVPAMEWQAREWQARTGVPCKFFSEMEESPLDPELRTAAFRIFQETLTNVARHAQATAVQVRLKSESGRLLLEVADNGRGITERERAGLKSLGLVGMRERAAMLGGEFHIGGTPGRGTTVTVRLPLDRAKGL